MFSENKKGKMIILIFFLILLTLLLLKSFPYTPKIKNGISEIRKISISNDIQTIVIRGKNRNNPILLYLHGGPGTSELIPFRLKHEKLENSFTVVLWEQRACGKSYCNHQNSENMTINQFTNDTHELTKYLLKKFGKNKILLIGHSWGSALGLLTIKKYPEDYYAFVGSGQVIEPIKGETISLNYLISKAESEGNKKSLSELLKVKNIYKYPINIDINENWFEAVKIHRKWLVASGGEIYQKHDYSTLFNIETILAPEYTWNDFLKFAKGSVFTLKTMWPQILCLNLNKQIMQVDIPIYFFQGKHDYNTPTELVIDFYNKIEAPQKELIIFDKSAHMPMYEEADRFDDEIIEKVLPICK